MDEKYHSLQSILRAMESVLVAYSGGVDSTFLLKVSCDILRDRAIALTVVSPTAPEEDMETARRLATAMNVRHILVPYNELDDPEYAANSPTRCYFCKAALYTICAEQARQMGCRFVADGVNTDDLEDYRPGLRAATEHGVRHPLVEAGFSKSNIREHSQQLGLPTWNKPSSPCLSSRFPYGTPITLQGLLQVAEGERFLRSLHFREVRVRYHEGMARIEVAREELPRLCDPRLRETVVQKFQEMGFTYITLDLQGYRRGSLNEALPRSFSDAKV